MLFGADPSEVIKIGRKNLHYGGVETAARPGQYLAGGLIERHGFFVDATGHHRVKGVGQSRYSGGERDGVAGSPAKVTRAVPVFVVILDKIEGQRVYTDRVEQLRADLYVFFDDLEFVFCQRTGLSDDAGGDSRLAYIVQGGVQEEFADFGLRQAEQAPQQGRVSSDPADMAD